MASPSLSIIPPSTTHISPSNATITSYLKSYPYLFVRESDQTDYFCTVCDAYLKEEQLQSHLFEGHKADNLNECFVRINVDPSATPGTFQPAAKKPSTSLFICVVCWAKITSMSDIPAHRNVCKVETNNLGGIVQDGEPTKVVSTPDIPSMMIDSDNDASGRNSPNGAVANSPRSSQGSLIIDLQDTPQPTPAPPPLIAGGSLSIKPALPPPAQPVKRGRKKQPHPQQVIKNVEQPIQSTPTEADYREHLQQLQKQSLPPLIQPPGVQFASNCIQCSLCGSILPSSSYMKHLREFHRVACSLESSSCPLCMGTVPLMDMTVHLAAMHGIAPQPAVNALLLWTLANNTFVMNEKTKDSLRTKTMAMTTGLNPPLEGGLPASILPSAQPQQTSASTALIDSLLPSSSSPDKRFAPTTPMQPPNAAVQAAVNAMANSKIPSFLQALLNGEVPAGNPVQAQGGNAFAPKLTIENIVAKLTRSHMGQNSKESFQCLVCSKWFAVPPIKHMRGHIMNAKEEKRRSLPLLEGRSHVCLICYQMFETLTGMTTHLSTVHAAEPEHNEPDDLPLGATFETTIKKVQATNVPVPVPMVSAPQPMTVKNPQSNAPIPGKPVELDNAGRVKSGKVRKQCELCGQWSNIKWFFKHMSEVHQALFCRCCREYLPIPEQEEHRKWHAEPPYMGQKIRIENGQPVIIDRKERASLTPIGSLASWGGSSGGMVVKAVDDGIVPQLPSSRKRKSKAKGPTATSTPQNGAVPTAENLFMSSPTLVAPPPNKIPHLLGQHHLELTGPLGGNSPVNTTTSSSPKSSVSNEAGSVNSVKDTLMPKETCPVCGILITYKNLARHIKLRHKIKYKFCHKCRKLVPNDTFEQHKGTCKEVITPPGLDSLSHLDASLSITATTITTHVNQSQPIVTAAATKPIDASDFLDMTTNSVVANPIQNNDDNETDDEVEEVPIETKNPNPTSKTKLDSLVGKEFKHPRRKCSICNYTVSYSNFKRHLRNAHPNEYNKFDGENETDRAITSLSVVAEDAKDAKEAEDEPMEAEEARAKQDSNFVTCKVCGDHILEDFLDRHMSLNHGDEAAGVDNERADEEMNDGEEDDGKRKKLMRECPVCNQELRSELMIKHCKLYHKISIKWCNTCNKYLLKQYHKNHTKKHERNEAIDPDDEEEKITLSTNGNLRISTRNSSITEQEEGTIAPLKIKNLNELMEPLSADNDGSEEEEEEKK